MLQWTSCLDIVVLESLGKSRDDSFALARGATTPDSDIHIEHASVRGHRQGLQKSVSLRGHVEILYHGLAIHRDFSSACLDIDHGRGGLALTEAPGLSFLIEFGLSWLLRQNPAEVKEVDPVKLGEVVWVD